ncbi:MAG: diadenylate cyclase [Mariniblastus sp.]|nr:diadenylate cyclase [Mariniblastus sp.]
MTPPSKNKSFFPFVVAGVKLADSADAEAILILLEKPTDFARLKKKTSALSLVIATNDHEIFQNAVEADVHAVQLELPEASVQNQLTQAVLAAVAAEFIKPGSTVVSIYSGFDTEKIDTVSVLKLTERLGRLTARDLRKLETKVPLDTLKTVVDLAVAVGREGREGKSIGTMFVVGDHRKVLDESRPGCFDMVKGYPRKERNIFDSKVREGLKELAQLDGMFVISADGTIEGSARIIDTSPVAITMTKGLGSRHFAGAAISKNTKAIAVVVSQSNGTVRIFQNGEVVLRIEPMQRAMKWKELDPDNREEEKRPKKPNPKAE